jgi:glycosyltransferase involved in cell wall biosynthesis
MDTTTPLPLSQQRVRIVTQADSATIVAVIPSFNEERFIASVVIKARHYADHVIVVDDGSTDRTAELAGLAGARVVSLPQNMGKAEALNAGFRAARDLDPDVVVCLDGDAQHEPAEIPDLVGPILEGEADVVIGSRFLDKQSEIPGWRQVGQHTLTAFTNLMSGVKTTDSQSGFRAFSPRAIQALRFRTSHLSVESEMQFLVEDAELTVAEAPISVSYLDGNKRNPIVHGLQVLDALLSLVARRRPLLFFTLPGVLMGVLGLVFGARVFVVVNGTGELLVGSAILTTLLLIGGLLLAISGVMLHTVQHLVRRVQEEVKNALADHREL